MLKIKNKSGCGAKPQDRAQSLLTKLRQRQLHLAQTGRLIDSAKCAQRAWRVRLTGGAA